MKSEYEKIQIAKAFLEKRGWTVTKSSAASVDAVSKFPPIQTVTKPTLSTAEAAFYLNRQPQTLRIWGNNLRAKRRGAHHSASRPARPRGHHDRPWCWVGAG